MTATDLTPRTIGDWLARGAARLAEAGVPSARAEAGWLLAALLETDRGGLLARSREPLDPRIAGTFEGWIARRARREPAQHITGHQEFHGLDFRIDGRAMIPRPETEGVVDAALALAPPSGAAAADLGTGSGCIAVALAVLRPDLALHALDRSSVALGLARENAAAHGVERRIEFVEGDLAAPPERWRGRMALVLSNPPYVPESEIPGLQPEVREYDPRMALVAGPTGLEVYAALVPAARALLVPGGHLVLELGFGQAEAVSRLVVEGGLELVEIRPDLQQFPRILVARRPPAAARADARRSR